MSSDTKYDQYETNEQFMGTVAEGLKLFERILADQSKWLEQVSLMGNREFLATVANIMVLDEAMRSVRKVVARERFLRGQQGTLPPIGGPYL